MIASYQDLRSKHVLITGGANGIGESMVRAFDQQGARVSFCDIDSAKAEKVCAELQSVVFSKVDLTAPGEIQAWIGGMDQIDVLVNNAANDPRIPLGELSVETWDKLIALNLRSFMLTVREAKSKFSPTASVINFSSITFHLAPPDMSAYVASKGGILSMSRSMARELGPKGVRVNTISPGWIMTERQLAQFVDEDTKALIRDRQCIPELIEPDQIAEVALFLASDVSSAITGQEILADRGWYHS